MSIEQRKLTELTQTLDNRIQTLKKLGSITDFIKHEFSDLLNEFQVKPEAVDFKIHFRKLQGRNIAYEVNYKELYQDIEDFEKEYLFSPYLSQHKEKIVFFVFSHEIGHHLLNILGLRESADHSKKLDPSKEEDFFDFFGGYILSRFFPEITQQEFEALLNFNKYISANTRVLRRNGQTRVDIMEKKRSASGHGDTATRWRNFFEGFRSNSAEVKERIHALKVENIT
jgi:hypothetical protein